jgi:hypothetical protein
MPRIAAALGILATVAFCIGFNIQRYPVVWQSLTAAPNPLAEHTPAPAAVEPQAALASAIRPAPRKTAAEAKGLPQPIPLPQVAGLPRPIPAPDPAPSSETDELAPTYEMAMGPAEKYAGSVEAPKPAKVDKPKAKSDSRAPVADAKKAKPANGGKTTTASANKTKPASKASPAVADKKHAPSDKVKQQAQKAKPTAAAKPVAQASKPQPEKTPAPKAEPRATVAVDPPPQESEEQAAPVARVVERPLVPVRRDVASTQPQPGWNTSRSPWAAPVPPDRSLRRLPAVDLSRVSRADPFGMLQGRIPFYPTTGK